MAFIHRSNNRVLPANARAVDVAKQAIRDIMPVQQRRYHAAFEVQGFEAVVYHRLQSGIPCSCQAHGKQLASHLEEDGKMPLHERSSPVEEWSSDSRDSPQLEMSRYDNVSPNGTLNRSELASSLFR